MLLHIAGRVKPSLITIPTMHTLPTPALNTSYRRAHVSHTPSAVVNVKELLDLRHFLSFWFF